MLILGSENALIGLDAGFEVLESGGSALDAIEVATRIVEDNPDEHSVGYLGLPNLLGEVELDASIMDGTTRRAGTVGALKGFANPISVARKVMEQLPHVMLVGEGAARFARECGMVEKDLLDDEIRGRWRARLDEHLGKDAPLPDQLAELCRQVANPARAAGTVDIMAIDRFGHIASAVSTSGWPFKYPGRLGDSPIIGAGNYCDDRFGAAGCTGFGELAIRSGTARFVVRSLEQGLSVDQACVAAMEDLNDLHDVPLGAMMMNVVACDKDGNHAAASSRKDAQYAVRDEQMEKAELRARHHVEPAH